jgi:hypothetical protein
LNHFVVVPKSFAYFSTLGLEVAILVFISFNTLETAVQPISASTPREVKVDAIAIISASLIQKECQAAAILLEKLTISASVVAILFPSFTIVEPQRSIFFISIQVILANCAQRVAASSLVRLVETANLSIVSVNQARFSCAIPNCPPSSII